MAADDAWLKAQIEKLTTPDFVDKQGAHFGKWVMPQSDDPKFLKEWQEAQRSLKPTEAQLSVLTDLRAGTIGDRYERPGATVAAEVLGNLEPGPGGAIWTSGNLRVANEDMPTLRKMLESNPAYAGYMAALQAGADSMMFIPGPSTLLKKENPLAIQALEALQPAEGGAQRIGMMRVEAADVAKVRETLLVGGPQAEAMAHQLKDQAKRAVDEGMPATFDLSKVPPPPSLPEIGKNARATLAAIPDLEYETLEKRIDAGRAREAFQREAAQAKAHGTAAHEAGTDLMVNGMPRSSGGPFSGRVDGPVEIKDGLVTVRAMAGGHVQEIAAPEKSPLGEALLQAKPDDYLRVAVDAKNNFALARADRSGQVHESVGGPSPEHAPKLPSAQELSALGRH